MGNLAVELSASGQGSSTETSRLLQLLSTLNGKAETFSFSSQKSQFLHHQTLFLGFARRGPLRTLAWEDGGCSWRHGRFLSGLLSGSPLCVAQQKWLKSGRRAFPRAPTTFPRQRGRPVLGTSNGAWRRTDRDTDKKPKNAPSERDGNFCIRKMFNVMALYSWYFSVPSYDVFTYLINMKYNNLRGPVGTILFIFASSIFQ